MRKGIILAGGMGTRLYPSTKALNKHLLPIYDKPMIYYSLSSVMLARVRDLVIITTPEALPAYRTMFADVAELGMTIDFVPQDQPRGIAEAFVLAQDLIEGHEVCLALGDNIFFGMGFSSALERAGLRRGATIFSYPVRDAQRFGIIEVDKAGLPISIEEKPKHPKSNLAIPGLYFYDEQVVDIARGLKPSARGELEITDVNRIYMERGELNVVALGRGTAWFDAGNEQAMLDANNFVASIERRQGLKIGCIEEIAWRNGWIDDKQMEKLATRMPAGEYSDYLKSLPRAQHGGA